MTAKDLYHGTLVCIPEDFFSHTVGSINHTRRWQIHNMKVVRSVVFTPNTRYGELKCSGYKVCKLNSNNGFTDVAHTLQESVSDPNIDDVWVAASITCLKFKQTIAWFNILTNFDQWYAIGIPNLSFEILSDEIPFEKEEVVKAISEAMSP